MMYPEEKTSNKMNLSATERSRQCKACRDHLADLLLDPAQAPADSQQHLAACPECRVELEALRSTFAALEEWTAPEPSAFFDMRLHARLREVQTAEPEGFFERVRSFLLFSTGRQLRPAMAGALALILALSGGSYLGVHNAISSRNARSSATVNDLKILDNNAQALQQMDQLLDDRSEDGDPPTT